MLYVYAGRGGDRDMQRRAAVRLQQLPPAVLAEAVDLIRGGRVDALTLVLPDWCEENGLDRRAAEYLTTDPNGPNWQPVSAAPPCKEWL